MSAIRQLDANSLPRKRALSCDTDSRPLHLSRHPKFPTLFTNPVLYSVAVPPVSPTACPQREMTIVRPPRQVSFQSILPQSFQGPPLDSDGQREYPSINPLKSPLAMQTTFPASARSRILSASDPELSSPTSSISSAMESTDPDSPPKKLGAPPPPKTKKPSTGSSPTRVLPLRCLDQNSGAVAGSNLSRNQSPPELAPKPKGPKNLRNLAVRTDIKTVPVSSLPTARIPAKCPQKYQLGASPLDAVTNAPAISPSRRPAFPPLRLNKCHTNLTIQTPTAGNAPFRGPLTPLTTRVQNLRQFKSSPTLKTPVHATPCAPIADGADVDLAAADKEEEKSFSDTYEPNFDIPQSQEETADSYPDGPVCIYDSGIDLYLEPTAEIASRYDVVINVAREVLNPFDPSIQPLSLHEFRKNRAIINSPIRTPSHKKGPEYIHLPWEHNTEIVEDLKILVQLMKNRVSEGKRILVHCQCGVSRSASLIVAYGMYRRPSRTVQYMYDAVKRRSQWICPNMTLIMQLQEFHNILSSPEGPASWMRRASDDNLTSQTLLAPKSFGVPPPLKSAPLTGNRFSLTRPVFDLTVPAHLKDGLSTNSQNEYESGASSFGSEQEAEQEAGSTTGASSSSSTSVADDTSPDVASSAPEPGAAVAPSAAPAHPHPAYSFPQLSSNTTSQQPPRPLFRALRPEEVENTQYAYLAPSSLDSFNSPRTETFVRHSLRPLNETLSTPPRPSPSTALKHQNNNNSLSQNSENVHPKFVSLSPRPIRGNDAVGAGSGGFTGLAPISQSSGINRRAPKGILTDAPVEAPLAASPSLGYTADDPRSPVQSQHGIWGTL